MQLWSLRKTGGRRGCLGGVCVCGVCALSGEGEAAYVRCLTWVEPG